MRLVTFLVPEETPAGPVTLQRTGVVEGDDVIDLTDPAVGLPGDMTALLGLGEEAWERAASAFSTSARRWGLDQVELLAPVTLPAKVLAIGLNYREHVLEMGRELPAHQYWFNKQRTSVAGPETDILIPAVSEQVDYEGELGVVIKRRAKSVPAQRWLDVVAGFTVVNDVSVRDWQAHSPTFTMGKSFDTHCPLGPWIVTPDEVGDVCNLSLRTWVNGELRQDANTEDMIFRPDQMIEYLTTVFPLEPGDVLCTGTPSGVGAGLRPPRWLKAGDEVRIEIERVGVLENRVVDGPLSAPSPHPVVEGRR
ncbi:MAG TPA: fumarylacetoacetate hydrolase family protein [Acidimicrobiales bacterium]|jgi:2-keto-4-pentenoate hydratase/2-oxohepta-3-ene-1,7-dioic acid hydratase in catechol pathway|nr:fumarylacetoacetate hydrolase family protein [Acidimicrobiales bacterium]